MRKWEKGSAKWSAGVALRDESDESDLCGRRSIANEDFSKGPRQG